LAETFVPTEKTYSLSATPSNEEAPLVQEEPASFGKVLDDTMALHKRQAKPAKAEATGFVPAASLKKAAQENAAPVVQEETAAIDITTPVAPAAVHAQTQQMVEERDAMRGREIVQMVREELATLRKEFKLSQQMAWQGTGLARNLMPLRNALQEAPIPVALRALLIDSIQSFEDVEPAMDEIRRQLCHSMLHSSVTAPDQGVHVLAGPSGAGKSLMVARLAQHASVNWGSEQVAVISYSDQRAGAWNQTQLLSAQSGVDSFRATNVTTLKLLLEEHGQRKFIIIDTPGVQMAERVSEIAAISKEAQFHVVLPADASQSSLRRMLSTPHIQWQSLMISKLDEASQPWALIQVLTEGHVGVSGASRGERIGEWSVQMQAEELVTVALANLSLGYTDAPQEDMSSTLAMASARISRLAAQPTRSTHE
jgi:flagellar biosynthesis GTPase FlhF